MTELEKLVGKPVDKLTPSELTALASNISSLATKVTERQKEVAEQAKSNVFKSIGELAASKMITKLGFAKLPKLILTPDVEGKTYTVSYPEVKKAGKGKKSENGEGKKRAASTLEAGKITLNKLAKAHGGIAKYALADGREFEGQRDLCKALGENEKLAKKWSVSGIIIKGHAKEVTLVYNNGERQTVEVAVAEMETARKAMVTPAAPATTPTT